MKKILALSAATAFALTGAIAADNYNKGDKKDIVATAQATESLSTLVAAASAADLVDTLSAEGPYTVFAPTNDAFASIQSTVDTLLQPENKEQLQKVLKSHVVKEKLSAETIIEKASDGPIDVETVSGATITVEVTDEGVMLTDENGGTAMVTTADVKTSNGIVHIVDAVLVPAM